MRFSQNKHILYSSFFALVGALSTQSHAATYNIPTVGWLDRLQALCDRTDCMASGAAARSLEYASCSVFTDLAQASEIKKSQGFGSDYIVWSEYTLPKGQICVRTQMPSVDYLNASESELLLSASLSSEIAFTQSLNNNIRSSEINSESTPDWPSNFSGLNCVPFNPPNPYTKPRIVTHLTLSHAKTFRGNGTCTAPLQGFEGFSGSAVYLTNRIALTAAHVVSTQNQDCIVGGSNKNYSGSTKSKISRTRVLPAWTAGSTVSNFANDIAVVSLKSPIPTAKIPPFPVISPYEFTGNREALWATGYPGGTPTYIEGDMMSCGRWSSSNGLPPYVRSYHIFPTDLRGISGGPVYRSEYAGGVLVSRLVGTSTGQTTLLGLNGVVVVGPNISGPAPLSNQIANMINELQTLLPPYKINANGLPPIWDDTTTYTLSVSAASSAKVASGTTSISDIFWVDENEVVLGNAPTLTLRSVDFVNGVHQIAVGNSAAGPFSDAVDFEVRKVVASLEITTPIACGPSGQCMTSANVVAENAINAKVFAMPSNTLVARNMTQIYQQFKVPQGTTRFELRHGTNGNQIIAVAQATATVNSNPNLIFLAGRTCVISPPQNACTITFSKLQDNWPAYLDVEWYDNGGGFWRHLNNQSAINVNLNPIELRLTSGTGDNYTTAISGIFVNPRVPPTTIAGIARPCTPITVPPSSVFFICSIEVNWQSNFTQHNLVNYELEQRYLEECPGCNWTPYVSVTVNNLPSTQYSFGFYSQVYLPRTSYQFRVRSCFETGSTCSVWRESSIIGY